MIKMQENHQENNNFETIISAWRRLSGEQVEPSVLVSMSGDSPNNQPFKKKEEETNLLISDRPKGPIATAASAGVAVASAEGPNGSADITTPNDKKDLIRQDKEETKEAAGDTNFRNEKDDKSYLETESIASKTPETKWEKELGDKVDSVYVRPPPPHKVRSNASSTDDEDCGIKCLYYTLQCCDCVLM